MRTLHICAFSLLIGLAGCMVDEPAVGSDELAVETENGLSLNGLSLNGLSLNGLSLNGLSLNGLSLNGLSLNGLAELGVVPFSELNTNLQRALVGTTDEARLARAFLSYLGKCALPEGSIVTIGTGSSDSSGSGSDSANTLPAPLVLQGVFGIAPDFPTDDQVLLDRLAGCLVGHVNTNVGVQVSLRSKSLPFTHAEVLSFSLTEGAVSATWSNADGAITANMCAGTHAAILTERNFIETGDGKDFLVIGECDELCAKSDEEEGYEDCGDLFDDHSITTAFGRPPFAIGEPTGPVFTY